MNIKEELKASKRYEYEPNEMSFKSHKYKSNLIFSDKIDEIEYVIYDNADPEGTVLFSITTDITLEKLEKIIDIMEND